MSGNMSTHVTLAPPTPEQIAAAHRVLTSRAPDLLAMAGFETYQARSKTNTTGTKSQGHRMVTRQAQFEVTP